MHPAAAANPGAVVRKVTAVEAVAAVGRVRARVRWVMRVRAPHGWRPGTSSCLGRAPHGWRPGVVVSVGVVVMAEGWV
jgi:hypothetical protein